MSLETSRTITTNSLGHHLLSPNPYKDWTPGMWVLFVTLVILMIIITTAVTQAAWNYSLVGTVNGVNRIDFTKALVLTILISLLFRM